MTEQQRGGAFSDVNSWVGTASGTAVLATNAGRVHKLTATAASGRTASVVFMAKYVRRELRSLTEADREAYFEAVAVVLSTPTKAGQEKYGMSFYGGAWYNRWHLAHQTRKVPGGSFHSPWHASPSFFTSHAAFTDYFERALQSVNPKVAAHYWDFTIDAALDDWTHSIVWDAAWFGTGSAENDFEIGGRWANVKHSVAKEDGGYNPNGVTHNSYGIDTMPYNNNPALKIARAQSLCDLKSSALKLPGCSELSAVLEKMPRNNITMQVEVFDGLMHTPVHPLLGGLWGCTENITTFLAAYPATTVYLTAFLKLYPNLINALYYSEVLACPSHCSIGVTAFEDCMCHATDEYYGEIVTDDVWKQRFAAAIDANPETGFSVLRKAQLLINEDGGTYYFEGLTADESTALTIFEAKLLYHPPKFSDFSTPYAAAFDPMFFAVHAWNEKFWTVTRLKYDDPEFISQDNYWAKAGGDARSDAEADDDTFVGHNYDDPMEPFANAYGKVRQPLGTYYTNRELMALYSPLEDELPYIFDSISWQHCGL